MADSAPVPGPPRAGGAFVRDSASIAISQYLARAVVLVRGWVAAITLGPAGFGAWTLLNLILDYGSYATLGALQGLDLRLPPAVAAGDAPRARRLMAGAWSIVVAGGVVFAAAVFAGVRWAPRPAAAPGGVLVALMVAAALLQLAFQYYATALRAHGRFRAVGTGQALQAVLGAGLGIALVGKFGLLGLVTGWIAGTLAAVVHMARACPEAPLEPAGVRDGAALARLGLPIFAYYVASLVLRSVDRLALARYGNAHQLGIYGVALMASGLVLFAPEAAGYVLFPRVAAAYHGSVDRALVRAHVLRVQRALAVMMPLVVGIAIVWAGPAVEALLEGYRPAILPLRLLAAGALALSAATVPAYFLLGSGRQLVLLALGGVAALVTAAGVFATAWRDPAPAHVALAASAGYALFAVLVLMRAAGELDPDAGRVRFTLGSLLPGAWAVLVAFAIVRWLPGHGGMWGFVATDLFGLGYLPVLIGMARGLGMRSLVRETLAAR